MDRFTTDNSVVILVDHQTTTLDWVKSLPQETVIASCRVMAKMAQTYGMPLILTTTMEEYVGPTVDDIRTVAQGAFDQRFKRGGQLNCWDDPALQEHVKGLGRPNVILAGLTTDICLFWASVGALELGYKVLVVADGCGTMTALGDQLTFDRLRDLGVTVTVTNQAVTELVNNFGTPEGQKAQQINMEEIIAKMPAA
jgi:nicotinamidase-related amidase